MADTPQQQGNALLPADKAKIDYEHKKKMLEIVVDKVFLGIIIGGAGSILGLVASTSLESFKTNQAQILAQHQLDLSKTLEDHRTSLQNQQFLVQKRYEALDQIIQSYNQIFATLSKVARRKNPELSPEEIAALRKQLDKITYGDVNKYDLILPWPFSTEVERHVFLFRGLYHKKINTYRRFIRELAEQLTESARSYVEPQPAKKTEGEPLPARKSEFQLEALPGNRTDEAAASYLDRQFERWQASKKK
jgi:hypothetical protein